MGQVYKEKSSSQQVSTSKDLDAKPKPEPDLEPKKGDYLGSGVAKEDFGM